MSKRRLPAQEIDAPPTPEEMNALGISKTSEPPPTPEEMKTLGIKPPEGFGSRLGRKALDALPAAGAIVGGALLTPTDVAIGPMGTMAGATVGGMTGAYFRDLGKKAFYPEEAPQGALEMTKSTALGGLEGAAGVAGDKITDVALDAVWPTAKSAGIKAFRALSPTSKQIKYMDESKIGKTALDEGVVGFGRSTEKMASAAKTKLEKVGEKIGELYGRVSEQAEKKLLSHLKLKQAEQAVTSSRPNAMEIDYFKSLSGNKKPNKSMIPDDEILAKTYMDMQDFKQEAMKEARKLLEGTANADVDLSKVQRTLNNVIGSKGKVGIVEANRIIRNIREGADFPVTESTPWVKEAHRAIGHKLREKVNDAVDAIDYFVGTSESKALKELNKRYHHLDIIDDIASNSAARQAASNGSSSGDLSLVGTVFGQGEKAIVAGAGRHAYKTRGKAMAASISNLLAKARNPIEVGKIINQIPKDAYKETVNYLSPIQRQLVYDAMKYMQRYAGEQYNQMFGEGK